MYKIRIYYEEGMYFDTEMPKIPEKGDNIGFWCEGEWTIKEVGYVVYEFTKKGKYLRAELNLVF